MDGRTDKIWSKGRSERGFKILLQSSASFILNCQPTLFDHWHPIHNFAPPTDLSNQQISDLLFVSVWLTSPAAWKETGQLIISRCWLAEPVREAQNCCFNLKYNGQNKKKPYFVYNLIFGLISRIF